MSLSNIFSLTLMLQFFAVSLSNVQHERNTEDDALFLTPYIDAGRIAEAQKLAKVKPMMKHDESFAGFMTVNRSTNSNMFFWLFKSQQGNWEERPLVVWLHGGPGYSSLVGLFGEVGPFFVSEPTSRGRKHTSTGKKHNDIKCLSNNSATSIDEYTRLNMRVEPEVRSQPEMRMKAGKSSRPEACGEPKITGKQDWYYRETKLRRRKFAWNRKYNLLFIDNPVGAGYSFADTESAYPRDLAAITRDLYEFLAQFYALFPFLKNNKLILTGDSYSAKFVLGVTVEIKKWSQVSVTDGSKSLNLVPLPAGLVALSGFVDPNFDTRYASVLYNLGLVDRRQSRYLESLEETLLTDRKSGNYLDAFRVMSQEGKEIRNVTGLKRMTNFIHDKTAATWADHIFRFLNRTDFRAAIHVGNHEINPKDLVVSRMQEDFLRSVRPLLELLLATEEVPIMFLAGQVDVDAPYNSQSQTFAALEWPRAKEYRDAKRCQFRVGGRVAAYFKSAGTFTQVLVRNAGHMIPYFQPKCTNALLDQFVTNFTNFQCGG